MVDLFGLISGDNVFKYSFTLGIVMIAFSIIYPMEKRHELELERVKYREEVSLISLDIEILKKIVSEAKNKNQEFLTQQKLFHKLSTIKKNGIRKEFRAHISKLDQIELYKKQLSVKEAKLEGLNERISTLSKQTAEFGAIAFWMKIAGVGLSVFGFIFWNSQTFFEKPKR